MDRSADAYSVVRSGSSSTCSCMGVMSAWRPDFTGTVAVCAAWWGQAVWVGMFLCSWLEITVPTRTFAAVQQKHLDFMCLLLCHGSCAKVTLSLKYWFAEARSALPCKEITVSDSLIQGSPFLQTPGFSDRCPRGDKGLGSVCYVCIVATLLGQILPLVLTENQRVPWFLNH